MATEITGNKALRELIEDLKDAGDDGKRRKQLLKEMRSVARPVVPQLKAAIQRIPSKGHRARKGRKGTLRSEMSRAATAQVRTTAKGAGVFIFMNPRKMPDGTKSLPAYFEQKPGYTRLRHPLFGNPEKWVQQDVPQRGYFTKTVEPLGDNAERALKKMMDKTARDLER